MLSFSPVWFSVLLGNFLLLVYILNLILFKPIQKTFKERKNVVEQANIAARDMHARKDEALETMKKELGAARAQAREIYETLRNEGQDKNRQIISAAHAEALKISGKIKDELAAETGKARKAMRDQVEKFSDTILEKLIKA
ncbi:MAG: ATP synthase F0 subunit B [Actinomycetota bacterium]|nr:ATP synthase F0 subunit B [Actinomycetota bacterium]